MVISAPGRVGRARRGGFTIVELLVAMALIILIMTILAEAFSASLESFRQLRVTGNMQEKLRQAANTIRKDLRADHFTYGGDSGSSPANPLVNVNRRRKVSEFDLSPQPTGVFQQPPMVFGGGGFFRIWNGSRTLSGNVAGGPIGNWEGSDSTVDSFLVTDHALHFTVNLAPNGQKLEQFFATSLLRLPNADFTASPFVNLPPAEYQSPTNQTVRSQYAEVAYFLSPLAPATANGTPLFSLRRRVRLVVPDNSAFAQTQVAPNPNPTFATGWFMTTPSAFPANAADVTSMTDATACLSPPNVPIPTPTPGPVSAPPGVLPVQLLSMQDLATPYNRFGMSQLPQVLPPTSMIYNTPSIFTGMFATVPVNTPPPYPVMATGDDIVLTDVVSFEVRVFSPQTMNTVNPTSGLPPAANDFVDLFTFDSQPSGTAPANLFNSLNPIFSGANTPRVFDTWTAGVPGVATSPSTANPDPPAAFYSFFWNDTNTATPAAQQVFRLPLKIQVTAVQIIIRIWDVKSQQTRQVTIVQDI